MNKNEPFIYQDEIPDAEKNPQFWSTINNINFRNSVTFLILNEIRSVSKAGSANLSSEQCRTTLGKLEGLVSLLDFPRAITTSIQEEITEQEPGEDQ